jgi:hypothetical protein
MNPSDQHDKPQTFTASLPPGLSIQPAASRAHGGGETRSYTASLPPGWSITPIAGVVCGPILFTADTAITEGDADVPFIRPSGPTNGTDPNSADGPRKAAPDAPEQAGEDGATKP